MKKSNIIFIIISVVVILAILLYALESTEHLLSRFYWGDRITVTIDCTANGVTVLPDHEQVKCTAEDDQQEVVRYSTPNKYSVRANEYGMYTFTFPIEKYTVNLKLVHTNWWEINSCRLSLEIDEQSQAVSYTLTDNKGEEVSGTDKLSGSTISLYHMF